jgi:hypothetical protein
VASSGNKIPYAGFLFLSAAQADVGEVLRATDRDHASELGELGRADAGGEGKRRAHG